MKRAFSVILIAAMLITCTFASADYKADTFVFRNGVTWGMSQADVLGSEGTAGQAYEVNGFQMLQFLDVPVSKFTAILFYVFDQDQLGISGYMIDPGTQDTFEYLGNALCSVYGDSAMETDITDFMNILTYLNPTAYTAEEVAEFPIARWTTGDGTDIWMVWENVERTNVIEIIYVSPAVQEVAAQPAFNTNGL